MTQKTFAFAIATFQKLPQAARETFMQGTVWDSTPHAWNITVERPTA